MKYRKTFNTIGSSGLQCFTRVAIENRSDVATDWQRGGCEGLQINLWCHISLWIPDNNVFKTVLTTRSQWPRLQARSRVKLRQLDSETRQTLVDLFTLSSTTRYCHKTVSKVETEISRQREGRVRQIAAWRQRHALSQVAASRTTSDQDVHHHHHHRRFCVHLQRWPADITMLKVLGTFAPEARCIKERSSDLRHSCGALLNATPAPTGALRVFLDHKKTSHPWTQSRDIMT